MSEFVRELETTVVEAAREMRDEYAHPVTDVKARRACLSALFRAMDELDKQSEPS